MQTTVQKTDSKIAQDFLKMKYLQSSQILMHISLGNWMHFWIKAPLIKALKLKAVVPSSAFSEFTELDVD